MPGINTRPVARPVARLLAGLAAGLAITQAATAQPDEPTLFLAHYYSLGGTVASYTINPDGTLTLKDNEPAGTWTDALAISPDGGMIAAGNGAGSSDGSSSLDLLFFLRVAADGSLTYVNDVWVPTSPTQLQWIDEDTLVIGRSDLSASQIIVYDVDREAGTLTQIDLEPSGGFMTSVILNNERTKLYCNDSNANTVKRYDINPDGTLTYEDVVGVPIFPLDLTLSPDGKELYFAGGISSNREKVAGYSVLNAESQFIKPLPNSPYISDGNSPKSVTFSADGAFAYVGHGTDSTVRTFEVDEEDGSLASTGYSFDVGLQGTLGEVAAYGDFIFFADDSTATDGISGIYSFEINSDGSLTQADFQTAATVRPEGDVIIWAPESGPCDADVNGDGKATPADFTAWLACFNNMKMPNCDAADVNNDGSITPADFTAWLAAFNAGCN